MTIPAKADAPSLNAVGGGSQAVNQRAVEVIRSTAKVKCWSYSTGSWMETC